MPVFDLRNSKTIYCGNNRIKSVYVRNQKIWSYDPFPAISGDFIHYRQEDVSTSGALAAHGLPLHMDLSGELNRDNIAGADYMDCSVGALDVVKDTPWPETTPFAIWMLHAGYRVNGAFYNGAALYTQIDSNLIFNMSSTRMWISAFYAITDGTRLPSFNIPPPSGPETLTWIKPTTAPQVATMRARRNGVDLGAATGGNVGRNIRSNGATFTIGGRRDPTGGIIYSGLAWRDVVIKIGADFTEDEYSGLEAYAALRKSGA